MRPSPDVIIHAPEFPARLRWVGAAFVRVAALLGQHAVLVEFFDFARINSLRTLPYLKEWHARYADCGLAIIGIHTPGYSFGRDPDVVGHAVKGLEIPY